MSELLQQCSTSDDTAAERLLPLVYAELRSLGAHYLRSERRDHTLQATALVHEAYLKMVNQKVASWQNRIQFGRIAARAMRQVLVEHARAHQAAKRGADFQKIHLDETRELGAERNPDLVELDDLLQEFAELYPRQSEVVELKFFGGLNAEEIGQALGVSVPTVKRDWSFARAWLWEELNGNVA